MKKFYKLFFKETAFAALLFTLLNLLNTLSLNAQEGIVRTELTSLVEIKPVLYHHNFLATHNLANAEGNFVIKDGYLDDLKAFTLSMPLSAVNQVFAADSIKGSLDFKLTHVMILPILGLVHIIGDLELAGVTKRTELDFKYQINQDQTITLLGSKTIKLSDYNKQLISNGLTAKNKNEINLELKFLFKNSESTFLAAN